MDLSQRAVIARAVVLTFGYAAADAGVHFLYVFIHHIKNPPFLVSTVWVNLQKIIDIFIFFLYNIKEEKYRAFFRF